MEWSEFAEHLGRELAGLDRDTILIVREHDESRHYVQAMREPDRLYAEAVSNNFLEGPLLLTPADEEVLTEAGWRPPTADWSPANWWTELPPLATTADYAGLADMMVTALRDVQGLRRPADLVYESFHRHGTGLIELVDFGIPPAAPGRITEHRAAGGNGQASAPEAGGGADRAVGPRLNEEDAAMLPAPPEPHGPAPEPHRAVPEEPHRATPEEPHRATPEPHRATPEPHRAVPEERHRAALRDVNGAAPSGHPAHQPPPRPPSPPRAVPDENAAPLETRLTEAKQRGDHLACFELLLTTDHLLLLTDETAADQGPGRFATTTIGTGTYLMAFTSHEAMGGTAGETMGDRSRGHRTAGFGELAAAWPHPHWSLVVNAGLPSEIHLDAATVARLDDMRRTAARAATVDAIVDTPPATAPIAGLPHGSRLWCYNGRSPTPVASYDAANGRWTVADVAPRAE